MVNWRLAVLLAAVIPVEAPTTPRTGAPRGNSDERAYPGITQDSQQ